ncbi:DUF3152 domain-containing protein [Actinoplanes sp. NPDC051494]|uniref:DUF3152 domain-containing protein n=1 Tax=Actinoplanes sp. NPDC051494 TaxID=3363907 RepID=UPI0037AEBA32
MRIATVALAAAVATGLGLASCRALQPVAAPAPDASAPAVAPELTSRAPARPARTTRKAITYPAGGGGEWRTAPASTLIGGDTGTLLRYRVLVEKDIDGLNVRRFADAVSETLEDPRGWTAGGTLRLRRTGPGEAADFTVYLATPRTRDRLCESAPDGYTSCRNGDKVVLNVARWVKGVPNFGASLATYRQYMVNHEVGHRLGHGHERCGGAGEPAPVMQQQTLGLHGCKPNPWPYLDGERHTGTPGAYDDPVPPQDNGA